MKTTQNSVAERPPMIAFQEQCVEMFIHMAVALSLPRSIGEIYGLLLSTEQPLSLDDVTHLLGMSRGSANQGLRWLCNVGGVRSVYLAGVRKEHFTAEMELRKLAAVILRERVEPHLESGREWLDKLNDAASREDIFAADRVKKLRSWHSAVEKALPILKALSGKV